MTTTVVGNSQRTRNARGRLSLRRRILAMLLLGTSALTCASTPHAADGALGIAISPEGARLIRDWRRSQGLPQAPEASDVEATANGACCGACLNSQGSAGTASTPRQPAPGAKPGLIGSQGRYLERIGGDCIATRYSV